jgi:hypothetical protein
VGKKKGAVQGKLVFCRQRGWKTEEGEGRKAMQRNSIRMRSEGMWRRLRPAGSSLDNGIFSYHEHILLVEVV